MIASIAALVPSFAQWLGLLCVIATAAAFCALGAAIGSGRRLPEADLFAGWAVATAAFVVAGLLGPIAFVWVTASIFAASGLAVLALAWRRRLAEARAAMVACALAVPLLSVVAAMVPSQWDEFTQWLPNARHLIEHGTFPRLGGPPIASSAPAYPYGLPIVIYLASSLAGRMVENAGALFNVLLLACFGFAVARVIAMANARARAPARLRLGIGVPGGPIIGWSGAALGLLAATALNPTFVPKIVFTAYADTGTAAALGLAFILIWMSLNGLAENDPVQARTFAWQAGLVGAALIALKQANLALLACLILAGVIVAAADRGIRTGAAIPVLARACILPIALYLLWRLYVARNLTGGEFEIRSLAAWWYPLLWDIIARMARIASQKGGYFGVMMVAVGFALCRLGAMARPFDRLAVLAAATFIGYNLFLLFTYLAAFGEYDARRAASYWRYNMHLGGVSVVFAAYGVAYLWDRYADWRPPRALTATIIAVMVILPLALAPKLRFDIRAPKIHVRAVAGEIAEIVPAGARLAVLDTTDNGFYIELMRYLLHQKAEIVASASGYSRAGPAELSDLLVRSRAGFVWVHVATPDVVAALGARLGEGASHLLVRDGAGWSVVRSWLYPGYQRPSEAPD